MIQTSNPVLQHSFENHGYVLPRGEAMTIQGTIWKTLVLLLCVLLTAGWSWSHFLQAKNPTAGMNAILWIGVIGGMALAIATAFKPAWSPVTAPLYALFEGLFIGGISSLLNQSFPGIAVQAAGLTFGTLATMLFAYQSGWIKVTERLKLGIVAATGGIAIVYLGTLVLGLFGVQVPYIYGNGVIGIAFSLFVVAIAALNLVLDFDIIEQGARRGAPKYMEWYGAFALMVTLIWLYIEFLRLLSKMRSR